MKKVFSLLSVVCLCMSMFFLPANAVEVFSKEEIYAAFLNVAEEKAAAYDHIGFSPVDFEDFTMTSMEEVEEFAAFYDALAEAQSKLVTIDDMASLDSDGIQPLSTAGVRHTITVEAGSLSVEGFIAYQFETQLSGGVQVFVDDSMVITRLSIGRNGAGYSYVRTTDASRVDSRNPQKYNIVMQGTLNTPDGPFTGVYINDVCYCSDTGVVS